MLAIVIPYYKLTFFESTLQSLANQTDKRFNVYIGDDASPEAPTVLLEKYKGRFDFIYHRFESNLGGISLTKQWERCIALSSNEEWLMILGDDDVLSDTVVEYFYSSLQEIEENEINVVRYATQVLDEISNTVSKVFVNPKFEYATDFYYRRYSGLVRCSLSEHIFSKENYLKYYFQNYPLAWHSDDYAWIQFSERKPIFAINDAVVMIRVSDISLSGINTNEKEKKIAESMFYIDLVNNHLSLFKKGERFHLLLQVEVSIKRLRKLRLEEWFKLFLKYIQNFGLIVFLKFIRRFFKSFK